MVWEEVEAERVSEEEVEGVVKVVGFDCLSFRRRRRAVRTSCTRGLSFIGRHCSMFFWQ